MFLKNKTKKKCRKYKVVPAIFYMHHISGICAGKCPFCRTNQMEKFD